MLGLLFVILIVANCLESADKAFARSMYGQDFLPTYTAGQFIRQGKLDQIYDPVALSAAEQQTEQESGIEVKHVYGAWLNPPFAALPAVWLAQWPYWTALKIWSVLMACLTVVSVVLLIRLLPSPRHWQDWALIPLLMFTAMPLWQATMHAQNTPFALAVLAGSVALWREGKIVAAGLMAGLLAYKPQLGAVVAVVMIVVEGRRALLGLAMTGTMLLALSVLVLPGSLSNYLHQLPAGLQLIQSQLDYTWHRHVTWLGFWRVLLQGHVAALPGAAATILADACTAACAAALAWVVWKHRLHARDRLIAASIVSMPLIMPYYVDYDLTLLAVGAVVCAADFIETGVDRRIFNAWCGLYLLSEVGTGIAGSTRVVVMVPMLAVLSALMIRHASRARGGGVISPPETGTRPLPMAA